MKWQRKLGSPKPAETFYKLYDCARMLEQHEKQYAVSVAAHPDGPKKNDCGQKTTPTAGHSRKAELPASPIPMQQRQEPPRPEDTDVSVTRPRERCCYLCREVGHRRDCPRRIESPGCSSVSDTHAVEAVASELSDEQLKQMLAKW